MQIRPICLLGSILSRPRSEFIYRRLLENIGHVHDSFHPEIAWIGTQLAFLEGRCTSCIPRQDKTVLSSIFGDDPVKFPLSHPKVSRKLLMNS